MCGVDATEEGMLQDISSFASVEFQPFLESLKTVILTNDRG